MRILIILCIVGVCILKSIDAEQKQGTYVNEGHSKVSRQSAQTNQQTRDEQMLGDQPSAKAGKEELHIPDGIFKKPGDNDNTQTNPEAYDDYERLKNKPDDFDWKLTQASFAANTKEENFVLSPLSVKILLTLLAEGAGDSVESDTYKQLKQVLPGDRSLAKAKEYYTKFFESINADKNEHYTLNLATSIFVDNIVSPTQKYRALAEADYNTTVERLDFKAANEASAMINQWVSEATSGHIKDLVTPAAIQRSVMLMINAIFFQGLWKSGFSEKSTSNLDFHVSPKEKIKVPYMFQNSEYFFGYSEELKSRIIRMPYKGDRYAMFIILPNAIGGLDDLIVNMDAKTINKAAENMDRLELNLHLPKFKFDSNIKFTDTLKTLGITDVFSDLASLPAIARGGQSENKLKVSNVIQKAGLVVDEKGSLAYAATQVELVNKFGGDPKVVMVDKPFVFYIEDEHTGQKLFAGKVSRPKY